MAARCSPSASPAPPQRGSGEASAVTSEKLRRAAAAKRGPMVDRTSSDRTGAHQPESSSGGAQQTKSSSGSSGSKPGPSTSGEAPSAGSEGSSSSTTGTEGTSTANPVRPPKGCRPPRSPPARAGKAPHALEGEAAGSDNKLPASSEEGRNRPVDGVWERAATEQPHQAPASPKGLRGADGPVAEAEEKRCPESSRRKRHPPKPPPPNPRRPRNRLPTPPPAPKPEPEAQPPRVRRKPYLNRRHSRRGGNRPEQPPPPAPEPEQETASAPTPRSAAC